MLNINCALTDIVNKKRISEKYGICTDKWDEILCYLSTYQWMYNNAWSCLTDLQKKQVDIFLKTHFNCVSYVDCTDTTNECTDSPAPQNDDCSGAYYMAYPSGPILSTTYPNQTNDYTCGVVDYPTDSGVTLPDNWAVDSTGDLWYTFNTGTSVITNPYITVTGGTIQYPQIAIYEGPTCGSLIFIGEGTNSTLTSDFTQVTLNKNTTYFIRVSNAGGVNNSGTFTITISLFPIV